MNSGSNSGKEELVVWTENNGNLDILRLNFSRRRFYKIHIKMILRTCNLASCVERQFQSKVLSFVSHTLVPHSSDRNLSTGSLRRGGINSSAAIVFLTDFFFKPSKTIDHRTCRYSLSYFQNLKKAMFQSHSVDFIHRTERSTLVSMNPFI